MESGLAWRLVASAYLALFLAAVLIYVGHRFEIRGWRLGLRNRYDRRNPGALDPLSGVWGWPRPAKTPTTPATRHPLLLRSIAVCLLLAGLFYIHWRWTESISWDYWPISLSLVAAETFAYVETWLIVLTLWRLRDRGTAPAPSEAATVDVFICCYNEPVDIVRGTVRATKAIAHPHKTYVLDDGGSQAIEAMAGDEGVGYLVRSPDWKGKPRHAKAGNLANALVQTTGEFLLFQDADQIPYPEILDRTLGYFQDPRVAFIQTPHWFYNAPPDDPLGAQSFIFYGPVLQGRDGFNAAFFCGSNGLMRREALMQAAVAEYSKGTVRRVTRGLEVAETILVAAERQATPYPQLVPALHELRLAAREGKSALQEGRPLQEVTFGFQRRLQAVSRRLVREGLRDIGEELADVPQLDEALLEDLAIAVTDEGVIGQLSVRSWSPLGAIQAVQQLMVLVDLDRGDEAQPLLPFSTVSITEDMATAIRMHAMGWKSVYHHEILARGLAPEDLKSSISQRLRWAQGAFQLHFRENPLTTRGLSIAQKLLYFHSVISYLGGMSAVVFMVAPVVFVLFGWPSIQQNQIGALWVHLVPYLILSQVFYRFWTWSVPVWRAEQYSLAFFPVWVQAAWSAVTEALLGKRLSFVVTPKTRQEGSHWFYVRWQLACIAVLTLTVLVGFGRVAAGLDPDPFSTIVNVLWACWDIVLLSVVIDAALYQPRLYRPEHAARPVLAPTPAFEAARLPAPRHMAAPVVWKTITGIGGGNGPPERELVAVGAAKTPWKSLHNSPEGDSLRESTRRNLMTMTPVSRLRNALGGRDLEPALVETNGHSNGNEHGDAAGPIAQLDSELPQEVARAYDEALRAAKDEIWNASVLMGRRALSEAMKNIDAEGNTLEQQFANAVEKGLLVRTLQEWAHADRMAENLRSDGCAEQKWMEAVDAREMLELCDWTFKYLHLLPAQIDQRRQQLVGVAR